MTADGGVVQVARTLGELSPEAFAALSPLAVKVYVAIGRTTEQGVCVQSAVALSGLTHACRQSVAKAIHELAAAGLITTPGSRHVVAIPSAGQSNGLPSGPQGVNQINTVSLPLTPDCQPDRHAVNLVNTPATPLARVQPYTESHIPPVVPQGGRSTRSAPFVKPDPHAVAAFFKANGSTGSEAGKYWDYFQSKGWKVGTSPMRDWQAAARNWIRRAKEMADQRLQPRQVPDPAVTAHTNAPGWADTDRMERAFNERKFNAERDTTTGFD